MAKPIETLSPADEAIFRTATLKSLQGAAEDPERIGAEYMPEALEPVSMILPDYEGVTAPVDAVGWSGADLVRGDGVTPGGRVISNNGHSRITGYKNILAVDISNAANFFPTELGSIWIGANQLSAGKVLSLIGRTTLKSTGITTFPDLCQLIIAARPTWDSSSASEDPQGITFNLPVPTVAPTSDFDIRQFMFVAPFASAGGSNWNVVPQNAGVIQTKPGVSGATAANVIAGITGADMFNAHPGINGATAQEFVIGIVAYKDGSCLSGLAFNYDLELAIK
jgi:hypothetical protein